MKLTYRKLSTGQRRRVDLTVALAHRPDLAVLDEPTSGLDPNFARNLAALLQELRASGSTLLVATHNEAELNNADNVVWLKNGRVKANGALWSLLGSTLGDVSVSLVVDRPQAVATEIEKHATTVEIAGDRVIGYGGPALRSFALSGMKHLRPSEFHIRAVNAGDFLKLIREEAGA